MKWLAKMQVPYSVAAKNKFRDSYDWHQALWLAFPGRRDDKRDFLTRVDKKDRFFAVYLLSEYKPICPSWCPEEFWSLAEIKETFLTHEFYRFDLLANPTRKVAKIGNDGERTKNGRREAILKPEDQVTWLQRKAEQGGFRVLDEPPIEVDKAKRLTFEGKQGDGSHFGVHFHGVLQVTDRSNFRETFRQGVGTARGFGFGMLMMQPVMM